MIKKFKNIDSKQFAKETRWLLEEKYSNKQSKKFLADVARLEKGEPVDYVIGFTSFLGCHIDLSFSPLIPRTETEFWVERAIAQLQKRRKNKKIQCLDLFSGSGCIGIALLSHISQATVDFSDIQTSCLQQIKKNIKKNFVGVNKERANIYKSDCFDNIPAKQYDYIFANPPYIAHARKQVVQKSVIKWEPHDALFTSDQGLYYIKKTIKESALFLKTGGSLFIEFDSHQKKAVEKLVPQKIYTSTFWKDQFEKWRIVVLNPRRNNLPNFIPSLSGRI